jgi:hypothetical protein
MASTFTWSLGSDFAASINANPTSPSNPAADSYANAGVWEWAEQLSPPSGPLTALPNYTPNYFNTATPTCPGLAAWYDSQNAGQMEPIVGENLGTASETCGTLTAPAGQVIVHPATNSSGNPVPAVVQWTSPITGTVALTGSMTSEDGSCGNGETWTVQEGSTVLAGGTIPGGTTSAPAFGTSDPFSSSNLGVAQGQTIDFSVAAVGALGCNTTQLIATITGSGTPSSALPEAPIAILLPLAGVAVGAGLLGSRARRRRAAAA